MQKTNDEENESVPILSQILEQEPPVYKSVDDIDAAFRAGFDDHTVEYSMDDSVCAELNSMLVEGADATHILAPQSPTPQMPQQHILAMALEDIAPDDSEVSSFSIEESLFQQ